MPETSKRIPKDYRSDLKPVWCAGCGNFGTLTAMTQALAELEIDPDRMIMTSGIGCASRFPYFMKGYALHGVHGRALPVAIGMKAARPELTVIVVGGDGDGFSIGGGHVAHTARKNVDITYIVANNSIYGLTKGQTSPTSSIGQLTATSPFGATDPPINPVMQLLSADASFVARGYTGQPKELRELILRAIKHPGFAIVEALSPCPTFNKAMSFQWLNERVIPIPATHDPRNRLAAFALAMEEGKFYTGVFYENPRPTYHEYKKVLEERAGRFEDDTAGIRELFSDFA